MVALWDLHAVVPALVIGLVAFLARNKVGEIKKDVMLVWFFQKVILFN